MTICVPLLTRYRIELYHIELYRKTSEWQGIFFKHLLLFKSIWRGTRWRSWLRHCASNWKVAGSIPDDAIGIFQWQSFRPRYGRGFDSASNGNEYQQYFLGDKGGRRLGMTLLPPSFADGHAIWEPQTPGNLRVCFTFTNRWDVHIIVWF